MPNVYAELPVFSMLKVIPLLEFPASLPPQAEGSQLSRLVYFLLQFFPTILEVMATGRNAFSRAVGIDKMMSKKEHCAGHVTVQGEV